MKLKKVLILATIISMILISIPTEIFAWTTKNATYEVCNIINVCISGTLRIVAFIIAIFYIVKAIKYMKNSKEEPTQKMKNIKIFSIIMIIQVILLLFGASLVINVGMETYTIGETYNAFSTQSLIPNGLRIIAFVAIFFYILKAIAYFVSSKEENKLKIKNLIIWEVITAIIVAILLIVAQKL